ncbi:MAG TPA: hypothetical protein VHZ26_10845 [Caulobacteraceae bacterium]|jgi:hypothetical protein|nr:hypothetical protein [Caulobacteraceae bacterium]
MSGFPILPAEATAAQARQVLEAAGWALVGAGDWSWVLADPGGAWAARLSPFDPGYRMFAEACLAGPANRWLPRVDEVVPLRDDAYAVFMQRLWPAPEAEASAFCAALGIANDTGYAAPVAGPAVDAGDPDLAVVRDRVRALMAEGAARYRLWAGSDIREGNVMVEAGGQLKLVDPIGVAGWKIVQALREGRADLLSDFSRRQLEDFLTIPFFGPGREGEAQRGEIEGWIARLYSEAGSAAG